MLKHPTTMGTRLFIQNFTALDYAYLCPERGLLGESFHVSAELLGDLDSQGFVMDFGKVKKLLKAKVDQILDHRLVVAEGLTNLELFRKNDTHDLSFQTANAFWRYQAPNESFAFLKGNIVSKEAILEYLTDSLRSSLPMNVHSLRFSLEKDHEFESVANFRYTHGLKYHDGNCQRLFHGHRNMIEVFADGSKAPELERELASLFTDIHFAASDSVQNLAELDLPLATRQLGNPAVAKIKYRSDQGEFVGEVPAATLMLLNSEPSIENIAKIAKDILSRKYSGIQFAVHAYEGLQKGAIAD